MTNCWLGCVPIIMATSQLGNVLALVRVCGGLLMSEVSLAVASNSHDNH